MENCPNTALGYYQNLKDIVNTAKVINSELRFMFKNIISIIHRKFLSALNYAKYLQNYDFFIPASLTVVSLLFMILIGYSKNIYSHEANEIGDFIAGFMSFIGLIWIIATMRMQAVELKLQREELSETRKANQEQADVMRIQLRQNAIDAIKESIHDLGVDVGDDYTGVYDVIVSRASAHISNYLDVKLRSNVETSEQIIIMNEDFSNDYSRGEKDLLPDLIRQDMSNRVSSEEFKVHYPDGVVAQDFHSLKIENGRLSGLILCEKKTSTMDDWKTFRNVYVLIEDIKISNLIGVKEHERFMYLYDYASAVGLKDFMVGELERSRFRDATVLVLILEAYRNSNSAFNRN